MNRLVAEDDLLAIDLDAGHAARRRSGRDDDFFGRGQRLLAAVGQRHLDAESAGEPRGALDPVDLVLLEQHLDAAGQARDHLVLARVHGGHVDPDGGAVDAGQAPFLRRLRDFQRVRVFEQSLGGNAAPNQAGAAERLLLLDDRDLEAQLRGANRGDISTGAGANHYNVVLVSHNLSLSPGLEQAVKPVNVTGCRRGSRPLDRRKRHERLLRFRLHRGRRRHLRLELTVIELQLPVHLGDLRQLPRRTARLQPTPQRRTERQRPQRSTTRSSLPL